MRGPAVTQGSGSRLQSATQHTLLIHPALILAVCVPASNRSRRRSGTAYAEDDGLLLGRAYVRITVLHLILPAEIGGGLEGGRKGRADTRYSRCY